MASPDPLGAATAAEPASPVVADTPTAPGRSEEPAVVVDRTVLEWLVLHALNTLWGSDQEDGCCDRCCAPCAAIRLLLDDGRLDDAIRDRGPSHSWWDDATAGVDRGWLERAWRLTGCHDDGGEP